MFPRRKQMRTVLITLALIGLVILIGAVFSQRTLPQISGTVHVAGLHGSVTVMRDRWGVPHIYAGDDHDLFLAQGYVTAQDRSWQMLLRRQAARGQLNAWLGASAASADDLLGPQDFPAQAQAAMSSVDAGTRAALEAYALGVNACLSSCPASPELMLLRRQGKLRQIDPWTAADSLALSQLVSWMQAQPADAELGPTLSRMLSQGRLVALWPDGVTPEHPSLPAVPALRQTAQWIGLPLLRDGKPSTLSPPGLPAAWYVMSLHTEGSGIAGGTWPGLPGVMVDQADVGMLNRDAAPQRDLVNYLLALPPEGWLQVRVHGMLRQSQIPDRGWEDDFSGETRLSNASAAVYQVWLWHLARDTLRDELGSDLFARYWATGLAPQALARLVNQPDDPWWDDATTPQQEMRDDILRRAYAQALDDLGRRYGDLHTIWEWDTLHAARFDHPLGEAWPLSPQLNRTIRLGGDAPFEPDRADNAYQAYAPVLIRSLQIGNGRFMLAGGQSGNPFSPHYADLLAMWARDEPALLQEATRPQDVKDVEGVLVLTP